MKGFFISQYSFLASCPCCIMSVVASLSLYCAWLVPLMFQTWSLTVSYLSRRVTKYAFLALCLLTDQCATPLHSLPPPLPTPCLLVRVVRVQKHTMLAYSNYSLSHLILFCASHYYTSLPGSRSQCVLLARPHVSRRLHLPFPVSCVSPLQDTLHLFPVEETGANIDLKKTVSAATLEGS